MLNDIESNGGCELCEGPLDHDGRCDTCNPAEPIEATPVQASFEIRDGVVRWSGWSVDSTVGRPGFPGTAEYEDLFPVTPAEPTRIARMMADVRGSLGYRCAPAEVEEERTAPIPFASMAETVWA